MSILKVFKDSFYYGVIPKISTVINLIILPIITPYLTPYDYGIWGVITSYSGIMLAIAPCGLHIQLTNSFYEYDKWKLVWGRILFYFYVSSATLTVLNVLVLMFILNEIPLHLRFAAATLGSFQVLFFSNTTIATAYYPIMGKPKPLVFRNLTGALCSISVSFVFIYVFRFGYWGFLLGMAASSLVTFILFIKPLYIKEHILPILDLKKKRFAEFMKVSIFVIPHAIGFTLLTSSSRILMTCFNVPIDDIGLFSNGYGIGDYVSVVTTSVAFALSPTLQFLFRKSCYNEYRRFFYVSLTITITAVFVVSIWMPEIYSILIKNDKFKPSILIASIICFANVVYPYYSFQSTICFIEKKTAELLWLMFLPGFVNVVLCCIFIPLYGYVAAAYTTLISFWTQMFVPLVSKYHKKKTDLWLGNSNKLFIVLTILATFFLASLFIAKQSIILKLLISLLCVIASMILLYKIGGNLSLKYGKTV